MDQIPNFVPEKVNLEWFNIKRAILLEILAPSPLPYEVNLSRSLVISSTPLEMR